LNLALIASLTGSVVGVNDVAAPVQTLNKSARVALSLGTLAKQADLLFTDTRTLAASATENLDLAGGLSDAFGAVLTFVEVVGILVEASAANTNDVVVGGAATNGFVGPFGDVTDKLVVKPGGFAFLAAPVNPAWPVVAGTGDLLKVANSAAGTGVDYTITIVGRSA
jgi:hypothetical protein